MKAVFDAMFKDWDWPWVRSALVSLALGLGFCVVIVVLGWMFFNGIPDTFWLWDLIL